MSTLASLLMGLAGPIAMRVLMAIGFTAMTFAGVQALVGQLVSYAQTSWSAMPATLLSLASLAGAPEGLGMICGAYVARVTMWVAASSTRLIFTGRT